MNSTETNTQRQNFIAHDEQFERRERRANKAIEVICQFRDTNSTDAGWVEDDNQEIFNDVIKRELNDHIGLSLGHEEEWSNEVTNLTHVLEKIKTLEASFERAQMSLKILKKKAQKAKRVANQIVDMTYPDK